MPLDLDRDITDRLYDGDVCSIAQNSCRNWFVMEDAAREIERLRKALLACVNALEEITFDDGSPSDLARENGRALLNSTERGSE